MKKLEIGQSFAGYEVLQLLGEGGMGQVYLALDKELQRPVAIKILNVDTASNDFQQRFQTEARLLASLNHPNIVTLYQYGEADGVDYMVMEYIEGETLTERIRKTPPSYEFASEVFQNLLKAMKEPHENGILHRDIKPDNIIFNMQNHLKLVDFGIAKRITDDSNDVTRTGCFVGTISYTAPEILKGQKPTMASDIFSIGIIICEILLGKHPVATENKLQVMEELKNFKLSLPLDVINEVPYPFVSILQKMTYANVDHRFQSIEEIEEAIHDWENESESETMELEVLDDEQESTSSHIFEDDFSDVDLLSNQHSLSQSPQNKEPMAPRLSQEHSPVHSIVQGPHPFRQELSLSKTENDEKKIEWDISLPSFENRRGGRLGLRGSLIFIFLAIVFVVHQSLQTEDGADSFIPVRRLKEITQYLKTNILQWQPDRQLASRPIFAPEGSQFSYNVMYMNESTGELYHSDIKDITYVKKDADQILAQFKDRRSGVHGTIKYLTNHFIPPQLEKRSDGYVQERKFQGQFDQIYPVQLKNKMEYRQTLLKNNRTFEEQEFKCEVFREDYQLYKLQRWPVKVIFCKDKRSRSYTYYYSEKFNNHIRIEQRNPTAKANLISYDLVDHRTP
jgi:serine/threonine protein kinase